MAASRKEERRVLEAVDRFIQAAMAISLLEGEGRETEAAKAGQMLQELREIVLPFLEGRTDLVTEMVGQLVMQRLPSPKVLEGFGDFKSVLEELLASAAEEHPDAVPTGSEVPGIGPEQAILREPGEDTLTPSGPPTSEEVGREARTAAGGGDGGHRETSIPGVQGGVSPEPEPEDPVVRSLRHVFPGERVAKNYALRGVTLAYYLPGRDLALEVAGEVDRQVERKAYLCREQGILLVTVSPRQAAYWRELARCLRRARNKGQSS